MVLEHGVMKDPWEDHEKVNYSHLPSIHHSLKNFNKVEQFLALCNFSSRHLFQHMSKTVKMPKPWSSSERFFLSKHLIYIQKQIIKIMFVLFTRLCMYNRGIPYIIIISFRYIPAAADCCCYSLKFLFCFDSIISFQKENCL